MKEPINILKFDICLEATLLISNASLLIAFKDYNLLPVILASLTMGLIAVITGLYSIKDVYVLLKTPQLNTRKQLFSILMHIFCLMIAVFANIMVTITVVTYNEELIYIFLAE